MKGFIFAPLGQGIARVPDVIEALNANGYDGWLVIEQDTTPADPTENARQNRLYLERVLEEHSAAKPQPKLEEHRGLRLKGITKLFSRMENQSVKKRNHRFRRLRRFIKFSEGLLAKTPKEGSHAKTLRRKVWKKGILLLVCCGLRLLR